MEIFWAAALSLSLVLYVLLDGFDLGIGVLFAFAPTERARRHMMEAIAPVWDGNETWLIVAGATLFGTFPLAYSILVSAFYLPVIMMLCGLILRGVAFEYRHKASQKIRWLWSACFCAGSILAAFMQGCAIGAFVQELPVRGQHFTGTVLTWLSPYSVWCGLGLVLGYALLGACWLVHKTKTDVRDFGYRAMPYLFAGLGVFLLVAAIWIFAAQYRIADEWFKRPYLFAVLAVGLAAGAGLVYGWWKKVDKLPLPMTMLMFGAAYLTMVLSIVPYMVPFSLTIHDVVAPPAALSFLFWFAGIVVLPLTLIYTAVVYWIFRGRVDQSGDEHDDEAETHHTHSGGSASSYLEELEDDAEAVATTSSADLQHDVEDAFRGLLPALQSSAEAEKRIEAARADLARTLAQLRDRLSPGRFVRRRPAASAVAMLLLAACGTVAVAYWYDARRRRACSDPSFLRSAAR